MLDKLKKYWWAIVAFLLTIPYVLSKYLKLKQDLANKDLAKAHEKESKLKKQSDEAKQKAEGYHKTAREIEERINELRNNKDWHKKVKRKK